MQLAVNIQILIFTLISFINSQSTSPNFECSNGCGTCLQRQNTCGQCGPQYYFDYNFRVCILGLQSGCQIYLTRELCLQCENGYKNEAGVCKRCEISRCSLCAVSIKTCMQCKKGFTFLVPPPAPPLGSQPGALV
jgi:hypothetical protein